MRTSNKLILGFFLTILVGTLLLSLIPRPSDAEKLAWIDAAFTATSAVCVTGLTTLDTASDFSMAGQVVILILIQIGGLGILTFSNLILLALGQRANVNERGSILEVYGRFRSLRASALIRRVILYTTVTELTGAILLYLRFRMDAAPAEAMWQAVFHSISAFCNAGFSLFPDSLMRYHDDVYVNGIIMVLIILGGLGFVVLAELTLWRRAKAMHKRFRLSLHTRVVLITTASLIAFGALFIYILESQVEGHGHFLSALFLSVTSRTAGFNTLNTALLTNVSLVMVIFMMFVGASPGSTGGGIKTTTFAVLWAMLHSRFRGRPDVEMGNRSIPNELSAKALITTAGMLTCIFIAVFLLQFTEVANVPHNEVRGIFLEHLFEVVSALCTVGLSTGVTPLLSLGGKAVLIGCMFVGRLGPLIIADSLVGSRKSLSYSLPEENIMIG